MRDDLDDFRRRVEPYRRELRMLLRLHEGQLERYAEFPRLARPGTRRLRDLIERRTKAGQWPPTGDEVDTDEELKSAMEEAWVAERDFLITGKLFRKVIQLRDAKYHTAKVLDRCQQRRDRKLMVRRRLLHDRAVARGIL